VNRVLVTSVLGALLTVVGCKSSISTGSDAQLPEYERPIDDNPAEVESGLLAGGPDAAGADAALVGARPDLQLASESPSPACECLAVAVGGASDPAFFWQAGPPKTSSDQLVVAVTAQGLDCPQAPEGSLGATYWGYRQEGPNVIVVVEPAREGRPMTTGAIIPRPGPGGAVYVAPQSSRSPYGRPLQSGERYCRVSSATPGGAP
jgi:hypothetical protein